MSYHSIPLKAGVPYRFDVPGQLILIDSTGAADGVDVALVRNGTAHVTMPGRKPAFRHVGAFDGVILTVAVDATVALFLSFDDVQLGVADGAAVTMPGGVKITNAPGEEIPVLFNGTVNPVLGELTNTDATAVPVRNQALSNLVDIAPVVVGVARVALVADATLKRLVFRNSHATAIVAIGGVGVTLANGVRVLGPGDSWTEDDAAGAAWYAISDTAAVSVQIGGVK